ncbi:MAG: DUF2953 domain-containing protein [Calditrichia bacterium]
MPAIAILAILFGLLLLLLSIPVDFIFQFDSRQSPALHFQIGWLFSLARFKIGKKKKIKPKRKNPDKKKAKKRGRKKGASKFRFLGLITEALLRRVFRLLLDIFRAIHFRKVGADIRAGLGEPADTGMIFGLTSPVFLLLPNSVQSQIRLSPDFGDEAVFAGDASGSIRLWPIEIIFIALKFIFSRPVLRTIKNFIILKWKKRN